MRTAALDGSITGMIDWRASKPNDFVYNRAGTIHAIGGGLMIVEVQQNVDCTYRLYDYGRPRELHLDEGLKVATPGPVHDPRDGSIDPSANSMLVEGPHFYLAHLAGPAAPALVEAPQGESTFVLLSAGCRVAGEAGALGEAVLLADAPAIDLDHGAREAAFTLFGRIESNVERHTASSPRRGRVRQGLAH